MRTRQNTKGQTRSDKPRCCAAPPVQSAGELWSCRLSLSRTPTPRPQPPGPETDGASSDVLTWIMSTCIQWCTDMECVNMHPSTYRDGTCQHTPSDVLTWIMSTCIHQHTEMEHVNTPSDVLAWIMSTHMWHTDTDDVNAHPVTYWDGTCQHTPSDVLTRMMSTFIQRSYVLARIISTCILWHTDMDDVNMHPVMYWHGWWHNMQLVVYWHGSCQYMQLVTYWHYVTTYWHGSCHKLQPVTYWHRSCQNILTWTITYWSGSYYNIQAVMYWHGLYMSPHSQWHIYIYIDHIQVLTQSLCCTDQDDTCVNTWCMRLVMYRPRW